VSDLHNYATLRATDFSAIAPDGWNAYYDAMLPWLLHDNADIRESAAERLAMAVFRAEPRPAPGENFMTVARQNRSLARMHWLLDAVHTAQLTHPTTLAKFLATMRYHGDHAPFAQPLCAWFEALQRSPPQGFDPELAYAARLLVQPFGNWQDLACATLALLDHPHTQVRACAARRLGDACHDEQINPTEADVMAQVVAAELLRPGVLGPFWSPRYDFTNVRAHAQWLLDILERRAGAAPTDLPFNDIDFYLHELCATHPDLIRRMMRNGFEELALMTATEWDEPIAGIQGVLEELAQSPRAHVARAAQLRLARVYKTA
jgi:hypothetical protein